MAPTRTTKRTAQAVTMTRSVAPAVGLVEVAAGDGESEVTPSVPACAFPHEMRGDRCPVAVFNAPDAWRTNIAVGRNQRPLSFERGVLAVFSERDAEIVRAASRGNAYVEANPRLADEPFVCKKCYPSTRWYSQSAYDRHTSRRHSG